MDENKSTIVVPWDFSQVAEYALEHAVKFSNIIGSSITLLNVVKNSSEIEEVEKKLEAVADVAHKKFKINRGSRKKTRSSGRRCT